MQSSLSTPYYLSVYVMHFEEMRGLENILSIAGRFLEEKLYREEKESKDPNYKKIHYRNYLLHIGYKWKDKLHKEFSASINLTQLCDLIDEISNEKRYPYDDDMVIQKLVSLEILKPDARDLNYSFVDEHYGSYLYHTYQREYVGGDH